ncbi:anti-sigma-factor antagonist [Oscillochloris trichoides DG-6]|uniref:Anti-sigma-factor antagonist n=1 Tax=Oscillochloris trichoides DG-6 TaxID=765420 RepID=E1IIB4_9CHLR|nr:STAS domain-containing protein [Oscillochloris trichoides]EFO79064.1 anti-sigma-factor antagonist [Oscillochloris trichoides DG-6]
MRLTQRQVILALYLMLIIGSILSLIYQLILPHVYDTSLFIGSIAVIPILGGLFLAYWHGHEWSRYAMLILITLLSGMLIDENYLYEHFSLTAFMPPVLALIVAGPAWLIGTTTSLIVILLIRAGGQGIYTDPITMLIYTMVVVGMFMARIVMDNAQQRAEQSAQEANAALASTRIHAEELAQKAQELEAQNAQQRQLIELVSTLETPAVLLAEGVILAPIIGHLDSRRARDLTKRLLREVSGHNAKMVIIDIAGVPTVDTSVAQAIVRTIQAIRLLGCDVTITGISASVAATMTHLGINLNGVRTARTPQEVMQIA